MSIGSSGSGVGRSASVSYLASGDVAAGSHAANSRAAWADDAALPWDSTTLLNQLRHDITISGGTGGAQTKVIPPGGGTAEFTGIEPGEWELSVLASLPGSGGAADELKAVGRSAILVEAGKIAQASVTMSAPPASNVTVTFNLNGGSGAIPAQQTVASGGYVSLPPGTGLLRTGYTFGGWSLTGDGSGPSYVAPAQYGPVTAHTTLYAKWTINQYTVSFDSKGGSAVAPILNVPHNTTILEPTAPAQTGLTFAGWYKEEAFINRWNFATDTVTANITLYAKWMGIVTLEQLSGGVYTPVPGITDLASVATMVNGAPGEYRLTVSADFEAGSQAAFTGTKLTIRGDGTTRTITLSGNGNLFKVETGAELTLESGITLAGHAGNDNALVYVEGSGSRLTMKTGSTIKDNGNTAASGGGVYVGSNGSFEMQGGTITGNTATSGGGVYVSSDSFNMSGDALISGNEAKAGRGGGVYIEDSGGGTFTMTGGRIENNTATVANDGTGTNGGGGVYLQSNGDGTFAMSGAAVISGNTVYGHGGAVSVWNGIFSLSGNASISGNFARQSNAPGLQDAHNGNGGGLFIDGGGTLDITGGVISGNTAENEGGGVEVYGSSVDMSTPGGRIENNTAAENGGGVYIINSSLTLDEGTISGNHATNAQGGGVFVLGYNGNGTLTMTGGTISGNTAGTNGGGVFVYGMNSGTGTLTMTSGTISGNTGNLGGGVYVNSNGRLDKTSSGGIIYGKNETGSGSDGIPLKNTARDGDGKGHVAYEVSGGLWRDSTIDAPTLLDSTAPSGGWEGP